MRSVTRVVSSMVVAVGLCVGAGGWLPADAVARSVKYKNCSALQKAYKHGVGKPKAKDRVAGRSKPVTTFTKNLKVYKLNRHLDRDRDGIACERR